MKKNDLDEIQSEAARIPTGATKLVSLSTLSNEVCWESLEQRRKNHRLTLIYKMMLILPPFYLSSLVPETVSNISRYSLRNSNDLQTIAARSSRYYHSFLPAATRDWNSLSIEAKQSDSVNSFKRFLNKGKSTVPNHYYIGSKKAQILHTRIRNNCSSLNLDLFLKNVTDSPLCRCGSTENAQHFFFNCRYYKVQRRQLNSTVSLPVKRMQLGLRGRLLPKNRIPQLACAPSLISYKLSVFLSYFFLSPLFCSVDESFLFFYSFNEVLVICVSVKVFARNNVHELDIYLINMIIEVHIHYQFLHFLL